MSATLSDDCAWVSIPTRFGGDELLKWLDQPEALFRINSLLEIAEWRAQGDRVVHLRGRNLSNGRPLDLHLTLEPTEYGLLVAYSCGLKRSTAFAVVPSDANRYQLRITDDYSDWPEEERQARLSEVDRSLPQWGSDLYKFFNLWKRWSWLPPWRWYVTRVWIRMKPSARRITRWILWITVAEIAAFLLVFSVFVIEQG